MRHLLTFYLECPILWPKRPYSPVSSGLILMFGDLAAPLPTFHEHKLQLLTRPFMPFQKEADQAMSQNQSEMCLVLQGKLSLYPL